MSLLKPLPNDRAREVRSNPGESGRRQTGISFNTPSILGSTQDFHNACGHFVLEQSTPTTVLRAPTLVPATQDNARHQVSDYKTQERAREEARKESDDTAQSAPSEHPKMSRNLG